MFSVWSPKFLKVHSRVVMKISEISAYDTLILGNDEFL